MFSEVEKGSIVNKWVNIGKDKFVSLVKICNRFCSKSFYMKSFRSFLSRRSFGEEPFCEKRKLTKSFTLTGVGTISLQAINIYY